MTDLAAPSLALARDLRKAIQQRQDAITPAVEAYDFATGGRSRVEAAANLMLAVEQADRDFHRAKADAVARYEEADVA